MPSQEFVDTDKKNPMTMESSGYVSVPTFPIPLAVRGYWSFCEP